MVQLFLQERSLVKSYSTITRQMLLRTLTVAIGLVIVTWIGSPGAYARSSSSIVRPRMLIGEHDPLTGFMVLRARYAAGARASDAIDGWALTYLLTRDETFARRAVDEMRRTHPPELVGSRTYPEYVKWSLAFDWLYNYA